MNNHPKITDAFELIKPSVQLFYKHIGVFGVLALLPALLSSFSTATGAGFVQFIGFVLTAVFLAPLYYAQTKVADGHTVSLQDCFDKGLPIFWKVLGTWILMFLIITGGFILFIVPGVIFLRRYILAPYYVIDRGLGIVDALNASANESRQFSWSIYSIFLIYLAGGILTSMLSFIFGPLIGILLALLVQFYSLAFPLRYFEIKKAYPLLSQAATQQANGHQQPATNNQKSDEK